MIDRMQSAHYNATCAILACKPHFQGDIPVGGIMKKVSKLVTLLLVLAMTLSLCACGNSAEKLYGTWGLDIDFDQLLSEQLGDDFADFSCEFPVTITFTFNEDKSFLMSVDKDSFSASLDKWFDAFITYSVEKTYAAFEEQGMDKATADEQVQAQFGCTMEEYLRKTMEESMNADTLSAEMAKEGKFEVTGNKLFIAESSEDIKSVAGNPFEIAGDVLTIKKAAGEEEEELIPGTSYPLTLNKMN